MAKTIPLWGQLVDLGPHRFFSSDTRVNRLWLEVINGRYRMVQRLTRIYYRRTFFDYPLKAFNALRGLGLLEAARCVLSYGKARLFPCRPESTFDAWVTNRFGERLYGIFFKSYSEKLWGIPCKELDADFAAQRIKKLSLLEAVKAAVFGGGQQHKTLVDEFAYPLDGAGAVYDTMAERIAAMGGEIHLRTPVRSVHPASDQAGARPSIVLDDGDTLHFDHIVSSMPITLLVDRMGAPESIRSRAKELRFRNTLLVYLRIAGESPFPDQWIYVHSPELQTGRITNFRNWLPSITRNESDTIICLEYWCYDDDELWQADEQHLVALATGEAYKTSLVPPDTIIDGKVVRVPRCYPVYATGYRDQLAPVEQYLRQQPGISVIGRYGAFKYNNQDHSILMGLLAAENITDGTNHDLWAINTDYEYQESSRITSTGLSQS
jgi:protoporphyrinogen oxidase